ncbi:MAG: hypothetical protein KGS61_05915 [Verrucomicrobia bacterium]|nr:hypothetical protein [Verrucomicrobiota bacterium]
MDKRQAQEILIRYRPGLDDASEPEMQQALELVRRDPELAHWLAQQQAAYVAIGARLRVIAPPRGLREQIISERYLHRSPDWPRRLVLPAIAIAGLACCLLLLWPRPMGAAAFSAFRDRMVRSGLRDYRMDVLTGDLKRIRDYLTRKRSDGDFVLTAGLEKLSPIGCALRTWHGQRAAMVCFDGGANKVLFLYVIDRAAVSGPPATDVPELATVSKLMTASWSRGDKVYVLAGEVDQESLRRYALESGGP